MDEPVQLTFLGGGMTVPLQVAVPPGGLLIDAVREEAREGRLPLYWRCGQGTCGACVIYLNHAHSAQALPVALSSKERNVLARLRLLSPTERESPTLPDTPELPRLACHVRLQAGDLQVRW